MGVGLGGCATTGDIQLAQANMKAPVKILAVQSPNMIDPDRLQLVLAPDAKPTSSASEELINQGVKHARERAFAAMESDLAQQPRLSLVTPPVEEKQFIDKIQAYDFGAPISQEEADHLQTITGADGLFRFGITDYGLTPRSWRNGYIAFEVTTTLALAAVIAYSNSVAAKAAAGIYLIQETAEEAATAYAGFWAVDVVCRPVRIEAELIRLNPVATIWQTSDTGLSDIKLSRLVRKIGTEEQDRQLDLATDNAVEDVVSDFSSALKEIKSAHN